MSTWTPEMEEYANYLLAHPVLGVTMDVFKAAVAEIRRLREQRDRELTETQSMLAHFQRRDRSDGARAMQEKCAVLLKPDPCSCNLYHGFCECGFDRMTALIEAIRGLKPANTLHDYGAMKRIDGARAMQAKLKSAIGDLIGWDTRANVTVRRILQMLDEFKPEDV